MKIDLLGASSADERRHLRPGTLERLGRLGAEQVHGAGDVGVVVQVVVLHRLDDDARLLRGVGAVQVDQRPVTDRAFEDREVGADVLDVVRDLRRRCRAGADLAPGVGPPSSSTVAGGESTSLAASALLRSSRQQCGGFLLGGLAGRADVPVVALGLEPLGQLGPPCSATRPATKTCTKSGLM